MLDLVLVAFNGLLEVTLAHGSVEGVAISGIVGAEHCFAIGEEANTGPIAVLFGAIVVQEFRRTFILANLHVAVIRHRYYEPVVSHLVGMVGGRAPLLVHRGDGFGVGDLVAGVFVSREAELVRDPFAKMTRAIGLTRAARSEER